jgi:hypothetical protein
MTNPRLIRAARREALFSLGHKFAILAVAMIAFWGLVALGNHSRDVTKRTQGKWQLSRENLTELAAVAANVAAVQGTSASGGQRAQTNADADFIKDVAAAFDPQKKLGKGVGTRQEFVTAAEQLVDAQIWRECRDNIRTAVLGVSAITTNTASPALKTSKGAKPANAAPDANRYLDIISAEEAFARTRIAGVHALLEAAATQVDLSQSEAAPVLDKMFDEKHPLYVLFQLTWYLLLSLAVLATAWLLMILFTVLPFTSAEGYWTKRMGDLLEKFAPGLISGSTVVPLVSTLLIAGSVLAGTGMATVPGGTARPASYVHTDVADHSTHIRNVVTEGGSTGIRSSELKAALSATEGAINTVIGSTKEAINSSVQETGRKVTDLHGKTDGLIQTTRVIDQATNAQSEIAKNSKAIADKASKIDDAASKAGAAAENTGTIAKRLATDEQSVTNARQAIDVENERQKSARDAELSQAAVVDERGFLGRAFGRTLFRVGPGVVQQMAAFLNVSVDPPSVKPPAPVSPTPDARLVALLQKMAAPSIPPLNSSKFEERLLSEAGADPEVRDLIHNKHRRRLLHLCALPRD